MKRMLGIFLGILCFFLLTFCGGGGGGGGNTPSHAPIQSGIAFFGDSIVDGGDWDNLLETQVYNFGVSGYESSDVARELSGMLKGTPDTVIVAVGVNDVRRNRAIESYLSSIRTIADKIRNIAPNARVFFVSILPVDQADQNLTINDFNTGLVNLCAELGVLYINAHDAFLNNGAIAPDYTTDGLHLSPAGYEVYADVLRGIL